MTNSRILPLVKVLFASLAAGLLAGCSGNFAPDLTPTGKTQVGEIKGMVHGGQAPVTGAHIYLLGVGTTGYSSNPTSLISSTAWNAFEDGNGNYYVVTDANGNFALGGDYTCTPGQQVYMVAWGGNPGLSGSVNNSAIVQMAGLGQCPAAGNLAAQVPYLVINEATTVAMAYAMSGYGTWAWNIGAASSTGSTTAVANAMANALDIVNIQWGQAPAAPNGNSTAVNPQQKIYALANILASCVNTSSSSSPQCTALFNAATDSSGNPAVDEANAIFNIAHNPGHNVQALYNLIPSTPAFSYVPTPSVPTDWTLSIVYPNVLSAYGTTGSSPGMVTSGAYNIAFDSTGNAWIGDRAKGVVKMTPLGAVSYVNSTFTMAKGVAVSPDSSAIWVADYQGNGGTGSVAIMNPTTGTITTTITSNIAGPSSIAFDAAGDGFIANETNGSVTAYSANGHATYSGAAGVDSPAWIAVDGNNNVWLPSWDSSSIAQLQFGYAGASGHVKFNNTNTITGTRTYGLAIDSSGNAWFASNATTNSSPYSPNLENLYAVVPTVVTNNNGTQTTTYAVGLSESGTGTNGGALGIPFKISIDGGNNIWLANEYYSTVSEWSTTQNKWMGFSGTSPVGYSLSNGTPIPASPATQPTTLSATPDNSGNLWTANTDGSVSVLLGAATPTANPIYPGVFGTKP